MASWVDEHVAIGLIDEAARRVCVGCFLAPGAKEHQGHCPVRKVLRNVINTTIDEAARRACCCMPKAEVIGGDSTDPEWHWITCEARKVLGMKQK